MSYIICPRCHGKIRGTRGKISLEQAIANHQTTCPAENRTQK
jgi:hypothetical protein